MTRACNTQPWPGSWARTAAALVRRPGLWATAAVQALRLATPRWWRRPPFVPRPDRAYLTYRLETQYGAEASPVAARPADVITYLAWCRDMARLRRGAPRAAANESRDRGSRR